MKLENVNQIMEILKKRMKKYKTCSNYKYYQNCIDIINEAYELTDPDLVNTYMAICFSENYQKIDHSKEYLILTSIMVYKYNFYNSSQGLRCAVNNLSKILDDEPFLLFSDLLSNHYYKKERFYRKELTRLEEIERKKELEKGNKYFYPVLLD